MTHILDPNEIHALDLAVQWSRLTRLVVWMEWDCRAWCQARAHLMECTGYEDSFLMNGELHAWGTDWAIGLELRDIAA